MNKSPMTIKIIRCITLILLSAAAVSCQGSKDVVTFDVSAEYRNAVALPPLKKPAKPELKSTEVVDEVVSGEATSESEATANTFVEGLQKQEEAALTPDTVSARVIEVDDSVRLEIDGDFQTAWLFVSDNLRDSDITLHTRNRSAGRFAIACLGESAEDAQRKPSGWSFFNKKQETTDHCALLLSSKRLQTEAKLVDRQGIELSASDGEKIFTRLLNN